MSKNYKLVRIVDDLKVSPMIENWHPSFRIYGRGEDPIIVKEGFVFTDLCGAKDWADVFCKNMDFEIWRTSGDGTIQAPRKLRHVFFQNKNSWDEYPLAYKEIDWSLSYRELITLINYHYEMKHEIIRTVNTGWIEKNIRLLERVG